MCQRRVEYRLKVKYAHLNKFFNGCFIIKQNFCTKVLKMKYFKQKAFIENLDYRNSNTWSDVKNVECAHRIAKIFAVLINWSFMKDV